MFHSSKIFIFFTLGCLLFLFSCDKGGDDPMESEFTIEDEIALGAKLHEVILQEDNQYDVINLNDYPFAKAFIDEASNQLIANSNLQHKNDFNWEINLINDPKQNSFALPGGYIYIYTGLLKENINDGAACYGVLGHEIGISDLNLSTNKLKDQYSLSLLLDISLGNNNGAALDLIDYIITHPNQEADSKEADKIAVNLICNTEVSASLYVSFLDTEASASSSTWLETHPGFNNRSSVLTDIISTLPCPDSSSLFTPYREFVGSL